MLIDHLYYAYRVVLLVDKGYEGDLRAKLEGHKINFDAKAKGAQHSQIVFSGSACPFAAKLETVKDYAD